MKAEMHDEQAKMGADASSGMNSNTDTDSQTGSPQGGLSDLILIACDGANPQLAQTIANHLGIGIANVAPDENPSHISQASGNPTALRSGEDSLALRLDAQGLALIGSGQTLRGDFTKMLPRAATDNLRRELLVKAAKSKGIEGTPTAIDATAGLGEDAFLLAAAGYDVQLYERDPVIAALLADALTRAMANPKLAPIVCRMHASENDSLLALEQLVTPPDVILLDPMFPSRQKSALIKKKFQVLQQLERPCSDEDADTLLLAAIAAGPRKVVIKRPLKGPYLAGRKPDYSLKGKAIRYDCIVIPRQKTTG